MLGALIAVDIVIDWEALLYGPTTEPAFPATRNTYNPDGSVIVADAVRTVVSVSVGPVANDEATGVVDGTGVHDAPPSADHCTTHEVVDGMLAACHDRTAEPVLPDAKTMLGCGGVSGAPGGLVPPPPADTTCVAPK
jgi:hypothetical protein